MVFHSYTSQLSPEVFLGGCIVEVVQEIASTMPKDWEDLKKMTTYGVEEKK